MTMIVMNTPYYGPPQGGYPAGPPPAMGRLVVHTSHSANFFILKATGPKVEIDGVPTKVKWGAAPFDVPAGNHQLRVSTRYLGEFSPAQLPVTVYPGQVLDVFYRPSATIGMAGSIGFQPVKTRGMNKLLWLAVMIVIIVVFAVLAVSVN
jgi:hypothetical protein